MPRYEHVVRWINSDGAFAIEFLDDRACVMLPDGQIIELPTTSWLEIADTFRMFVPSADSNPKSASGPEMAGKPWTPKLDDELRQLWHDGLKPSEMASHFKRTKGAIEARLDKLGLLSAS